MHVSLLGYILRTRVDVLLNLVSTINHFISVLFHHHFSASRMIRTFILLLAKYVLPLNYTHINGASAPNGYLALIICTKKGSILAVELMQ